MLTCIHTGAQASYDCTCGCVCLDGSDIPVSRTILCNSLQQLATKQWSSNTCITTQISNILQGRCHGTWSKDVPRQAAAHPPSHPETLLLMGAAHHPHPKTGYVLAELLHQQPCLLLS
jgi:hypothetical protein